MRIVVLGDGLFVEGLRRLGFEVLHLTPDDATTPFPLSAWTGPEIAKFIQPDDVLFISGAISPVVFPADLNTLSCPIITFLPDAPLHRFWMRRAAPALSLLLVDQPHEYGFYNDPAMKVEWLPLSADSDLYYHGDRKWEQRDIPFLFVGTIDSARRPKRSALLKVVQQCCDVMIVDGGGTRNVSAQEVADLYRRAQVVINENMFPSVNLRLFEAMACGALVLTEECDQCWARLFVENKHLLSYDPDTIRDQIDLILTRPTKAASIGFTGMHEVNSRHLLTHRSEQLAKYLKEAPKGSHPHIPEWQYAGVPVRMALRWQNHPQREIWLNGGLPLLGAVENFDEATWLDRASLLWQLEQRDKITPTLQQAVKAIPTSMYLRLALAWSELENDPKSAIPQLRMALRDILGSDFIPDQLKTDPGYCHFATANALTKLGHDYDPGFSRSSLPMFLWNGMEHFLKAVELAPDRDEYRIEFAEFLKQRYAVEEAGRLLEAAPLLTSRIRYALDAIKPLRYW